MESNCPVCSEELGEVIPDICDICGWKLSEDITLFPVLNEISKEEIEEYKKKVDTAKEEWKIRTELKKETEEKSSNCPVCSKELGEVIPDICDICGWKLSEDITLFPVLNEISKEEIEEYKKKVDTAKEEWKLKPELKKEEENISWNTLSAIEGKEIEEFVKINKGNWNHSLWSGLLAELVKKYGKIEANDIGQELEKQKKVFLEEKANKKRLKEERINRENVEKERLEQEKKQEELSKKCQINSSQNTVKVETLKIINTDTSYKSVGQEKMNNQSKTTDKLSLFIALAFFPTAILLVSWGLGYLLFKTATLESFVKSSNCNGILIVISIALTRVIMDEFDMFSIVFYSILSILLSAVFRFLIY